ncbi:MAG: RsmD family RNA methyltransferase [Gemmataceae bacterium]
MRTEIRIVAGTLRGRKVECDVNPAMRPTPQRTREALFSILGNAVPERPFYDIFAGSGVVGLEAISRGASRTLFVERDFRLLDAIEKHLKRFNVTERGRVIRADAYRWAERWTPSVTEPATLFLSPPFPDLEERSEEFLHLVSTLMNRMAPGGVLVLQLEECDLVQRLPDRDVWDVRTYGRNMLLFWVKPFDPPPPLAPDQQEPILV